MKNLIPFSLSGALGFFMAYLSITGQFKTTVAGEIATFSLGFLLFLLGLISSIEIIYKSLKNNKWKI